MGVRQTNSTNYSHSDEPNLLNLHKAMEYNAAGQPVIRTTLGGSAGAATDAFGRLRVSNPFTLFDSFHRYQDNNRLNVYTATGGSSAHNVNDGTIEMSVTGTNGSTVIRETTKIFAYQPGKSLQILQTFCMNEAKAGLRERIGYFDTANGFFLERDGTTVYFVKRSSSSGGVVETRVAQSNWNVNTLTGSSTNPDVLDLSRVQILFTDIEWLGVGSVRMGFVIDGQFVVCHQFNHANQPGNTTTYMTTACLPVRAEITNTSATGSSSMFKIICTSVISEGGFEPVGRPKAVGHAIASPRVISNGSQVPIFSMRLKSSRLSGLVMPKKFSIAVGGNNNFRYQIIQAATTSGGTWVDAGAIDSSVEYNLTPTSFTGGTVLEMGYIISSNQSSVSPSNEELFKYQLERNSFTSTASELIIALETTGTNDPVFASVEWQELT